MKLILTITSFLLIGCAAFNTPFINVDETLQLKFGMTQTDVLKDIGEPLFVKSGKNGSTIWVYEVRTIEVQSQPDLIPMIQKGGPSKKHENTRHAAPNHKLEIIFNNGKVSSWGPNE